MPFLSWATNKKFFKKEKVMEKVKIPKEQAMEILDIAYTGKEHDRIEWITGTFNSWQEKGYIELEPIDEARAFFYSHMCTMIKGETFKELRNLYEKAYASKGE